MSGTKQTLEEQFRQQARNVDNGGMVRHDVVSVLTETGHRLSSDHGIRIDTMIGWVRETGADGRVISHVEDALRARVERGTVYQLPSPTVTSVMSGIVETLLPRPVGSTGRQEAPSRTGPRSGKARHVRRNGGPSWLPPRMWQIVPASYLVLVLITVAHEGWRAAAFVSTLAAPILTLVLGGIPAVLSKRARRVFPVLGREMVVIWAAVTGACIGVDRGEALGGLIGMAIGLSVVLGLQRLLKR